MLGATKQKVLITGSDGFVGKNLIEALTRRPDYCILEFDLRNDPKDLPDLIGEADFIFHLAGVNRPQHPNEFEEGNADLTRSIISILAKNGKHTPIAISSSTQATLNNPYGLSKRNAEEAVFEYSRRTTTPVFVYRLTNIFGKWSRPNYNSVVSTFCYNVARNLDLFISDERNVVELVYIDDVVRSFLAVLEGKADTTLGQYHAVEPTFTVTLGELATAIRGFRDSRRNLMLPDFSKEFVRDLYATYLSYLDDADFSYELEVRTDERGALAELLKSKGFGQIFVSRTLPGITRGNHYHDTKVEKFFVLQGEGVIRFRQIFSRDVIEYRVSGRQWKVVDIPPGWTHSIENQSQEDMIVLFWASGIFDPEKPDTYFMEVLPER